MSFFLKKTCSVSNLINNLKDRMYEFEENNKNVNVSQTSNNTFHCIKLDSEIEPQQSLPRISHQTGFTTSLIDKPCSLLETCLHRW